MEAATSSPRSTTASRWVAVGNLVHVIMSDKEIEVPESVDGLVGTAENLTDLKALLILMFKAWVEREQAKNEPLVTVAL